MKLLFVCLGNRFRSLIAEGFAKKNGIDAISRGTEATGPVAEEVIEFMEKQGILEHTKPRPRQVEQEDIEQADMIVTMEEVQRDFIEENFVDKPEIKVWNISDTSLESENLSEEIEKKGKIIQEKVRKLS